MTNDSMYYNKSFTYVLPMLDWWNNDFLINGQLRGVFIGDRTHDILNNHIFLLYRYSADRWFVGYEEELKDCDYYVTHYEPDKRHTMFVYDVPQYHQSDYDMFKLSKYSKLTEDYKKQIVEFHGKDKCRKVIAVMYKHESMFLEWEKQLNEGLPKIQWTFLPRDGECADSLHDDEEIFDVSMLELSNNKYGVNKT